MECAGLGVETARALHATGADVFITARNKSKAQAAVDDILKSSPGKGKLEILLLDLESLQSVRDFATAFPDQSKQLNVLITNAGAYPRSFSKLPLPTVALLQIDAAILAQTLPVTLLARDAYSAADIAHTQHAAAAAPRHNFQLRQSVVAPQPLSKVNEFDWSHDTHALAGSQLCTTPLQASWHALTPKPRTASSNKLE